ncbi:hypothetical protein BS46_gp134 [Acinetobacter phage BS46]|nr:hypothetical protein BS46_gp134 [Acinetobacter phage BS46]
MKEFNDIIINELSITKDDIAYHKQQFNHIGALYVLKHPYMIETLQDNPEMFEEGDCWFCDSHSDENYMCVGSRTGKDIYSVCQHCYNVHNFINFNL